MDHVTWCVAGVIQGAEHEERYTLRADGWLEQEQGVGERHRGRDRPGAPGRHPRVSNAGAETAISLHIYGTDISRLGTSVRRTYDLPFVTRMPDLDRASEYRDPAAEAPAVAVAADGSTRPAATATWHADNVDRPASRARIERVPRQYSPLRPLDEMTRLQLAEAA